MEFIPFEDNSTDKIMNILQKDETFEFSVELQEESILITSNNMNTQAQKQKILENLNQTFKKFKEKYTRLRQEENKKINSYGKSISEDLKKQSIKELANIYDRAQKQLLEQFNAKKRDLESR